jgi:hypothetical protein
MRTTASLLPWVVLVLAAAAAACGSDSRGQSVCDTQTPPPPECMTECDPSPTAPTTCPAGYHCTSEGACDQECNPGGTDCGSGYRCTPDGRCVASGDCIGLECQIVNCEAMGMPATTITGTVHAPNGSLPLYGVNVYVPNVPLAAPVDGAVCDRCEDTIAGFPLSLTTTDENGNFTMTNVPAGANIPVYVSSGKWRREITIQNVPSCQPTALTDAETQFPKNKTEGYMPEIAISTGSADALECLVRKLGIDDAEIGTDGSDKRIHLYTDEGSGGQGAAMFRSGFPGGSGAFADSMTLWNSFDKLKSYDIVILSCEGGQYPETKPQSAMDALKQYADVGGRVFVSHWHNIWIEGSTEGGGNQAPAVWSGPDGVATWNNSSTTFATPPDRIDEQSNPKGESFATWMLNVGGSPAGMRGIIPIEAGTGKQTCTAVDLNKTERWVYWPQGGVEYPQMFQFTTPQESQPNDRCGKVVFSDMHVSGDSDSSSGTPFPNDCSSAGLTPQEKALAFMFFDLASCVSGPIL